MFGLFDISFDPMDWLNDLLSGFFNLVKSGVTWLMSQAWTLLQYLWSLVPHQIPWPPGAMTVASALSSFMAEPDVHTTLQAANYYSPVNLCIVLLVLALGQEAILGAWHGIRWLIAHLPWVGGEV